MANRQVRHTLLFLLLLPLAFPLTAATEEAPMQPQVVVVVVVEGMVYCQSCENQGTWSLAGAKPIPSAKVSVICKDEKDRVSYYNAFPTDANGYFYAQLEGFKIRNYLLEHPLQSCQVKLVSSPLQNCNLLSNVNNGLYGSSLRYESKRFVGKHYEAVVYAAGPLAFGPSHCPDMNYD